MSKDRPTDAANIIATVAAAYAARADVTADQVVDLVAKLSAQFGEELGEASASHAADTATANASHARPQPALPIEDAVTEDKVFCLCCGRGFKMLKRHLGSEHGLSEDEYRTLFNLPADMPLVAPSYSARKAAYAKKVGLGKHSRDDLEASLHDA
ncbi:MucR family transcriptional regulator [Thioclava sediminum]|uniref:MucR family transcriptional regulator n=1 Tax=Thioclava sediminum TaxID=1915319 RepID=A0ABX3N271_9RHOB|nr:MULTISPECIES: MucR family transcriptional regulator [Thioclava]OOY26068.1 MucR family transcriptional regulator [Thioclava sediminum]OOY32421.1 MucR family transcriptional regulator [Thioclava sp. F36-6]